MPNNLAASQHRDAIAQFNFVKNFYFFLIATIQVTRPLRQLDFQALPQKFHIIARILLTICFAIYNLRCDLRLKVYS